MGMEGGGRSGKHGYLSASSVRKLQAGNWVRGYAHLVSRTRRSVLHAAPQSRDPCVRNGPRISSAPRRKCGALRSIRGARPPLSRTQFVGILDHIGAATAGGAGGEQHETVRRKHLAREIAAHRQIIGDVTAGSIVQARERHVRGEFSPL